MSESSLSQKVKVLVLTGDGINCERETADAFRLSGAEASIRHLNDVIREGLSLDRLSTLYQIIALPGGFSFGDDLGSGKVLGLKIVHSLKWDLHRYVDRGGLVLGVCNGFQALVKMGIFGKHLSITQNSGGAFINQWVKIEPNTKRCVWLKGVGSLVLPIRHGEGRVCFQTRDRDEALSKLTRQDQICMRYESQVNGSDDRIAGLCDSTGRIFGLMPHPEAFVRWTSHPEWTAQPERAGAPGLGLAIFENAVKAAKESR
jgi:phosphoribosylformylglycinamidine (FGAM) synthase-like amidotransferase family enzyme